MKLGFDEPNAAYSSGSQSARAWTESWVRTRAFCPNCARENISAFPPNSPVADFFCPTCQEEYELKSQKNKFGLKVVDGAFRTMCARLAADNNPNLFLLNYDLKLREVVNFLVVPKHFFVRDIIEERKPLAATARRAGWIGCNILLHQIPESGKIFIVKAGRLQPKEAVLTQWQRRKFLRHSGAEERGWLVEVMKCVELVGKREFTIDDVYAFEARLGRIYPNNKNVKPKIRQQLQVLRDQGYLDFIGRGSYRLR